MSHELYITILYATVALYMAMTVYAVTRPPNVVNRLLTLILLIIAFWVFTYSQQLAATALEEKVAWLRVRYIALPFRLPVWLLFAAHVTGNQKYLTAPMKWLLFAVPSMAALSAISPATFEWFFHTYKLSSDEPPAVLLFSSGPVRWLYEVYVLFSICVGLLLLVSALRKHVNRNVIAFLIISGIFPTVAWWFLRLLPAGTPDFMPLMLLVTSVGFIMAGWRLRLFDMMPFVMRRQFFENIHDGVVVTDLKGYFLEHNQRASKLLPPDISVDEHQAAHWLPEPWRSVFSRTGDAVMEFEYADTWFERTRKPMMEKDRQIAWLFTIADISDRVARKADEINQASEEARARVRSVIVRDLHDGVGPVGATVGILAERALRTKKPSEKNDLLKQIADWAASGNIELRTMMNLLEYREMTWTDIIMEARRFSRLILEPRNIALDVSKEGDPPAAEPPPVSNAASLLHIIKEAVNNTARHSGATETGIHFIFSNATLRLVIRDNGMWPPDRREGRGLRHIRQRVAEMNGALVLKTSPETSLTCILPANLAGPDAPNSPGDPNDYLYCRR